MIKLNVGIIGLGVGKHHIDAFNSHPACNVKTLCDFSDEKYAMAKSKFPTMKVTRNSSDILEDPELDIVSVASYDNYHYDQIISALKNKKHVFVEKPLCLHFHEAASIKKLLDKNPDVRLSSNLNLRTCPRFISLKEAVLSGEMGSVFYMEGDYLWGRIRKLVDGWRKNMEFYSIIHGAAVHVIDLIMWITETRPIEVQGYGNSISTISCDFRYNDFAVILMKFENGMIAKITANAGCVHPHFHRVAVYGTEKTFINDIYGGKLLKSRDPKAKIMEDAEEYPAVKEKSKIITTFIDSILDMKKKAIVTSDDVFATMSVCFAAEKAIQQGKHIKIEYI